MTTTMTEKQIDEGRTFTLFHKGRMIAVFFDATVAADTWGYFTGLASDAFHEAFEDDTIINIQANGFTIRGR